MPPGNDGITACGSQLQFTNDNRYRLLSWGPGRPDPEDEIQGKWRVASDKILLPHQDRIYECVVTWLGDDQLEFESADGSIRAVYKRTLVDYEKQPEVDADTSAEEDRELSPKK